MNSDNRLETIKEITTELLKMMDFEGQVFIDSSDENGVLVNIQTREAGFLIGQAGINLDALQHLARVMAGKKISQPVHFILDINDYRKHRVELLKELAQDIARQALLKRMTLVLRPMSAYERRIIHMALAGNPQINTESIGQEPERRVVVKPGL